MILDEYFIEFHDFNNIILQKMDKKFSWFKEILKFSVFFVVLRHKREKCILEVLKCCWEIHERSKPFAMVLCHWFSWHHHTYFRDCVGLFVDLDSLWIQYSFYFGTSGFHFRCTTNKRRRIRLELVCWRFYPWFYHTTNDVTLKIKISTFTSCSIKDQIENKNWQKS